MKFTKVLNIVVNTLVDVVLTNSAKPNLVQKETGTKEELANAIEGEYLVINVQ